ncbi:MAG: DUF1566 domain-containing protein [SAR324 cluster bacterium]|uniref:DUF1566 domain-containing protein n=1 Tax=SAR324 cluster bacterium TaxID=2024889 RepID=A0A7X9FP12_9DELT|nr:DUF1566 domain-containing protein [SAR324 cluster bacterium]
MLSLLNKKTIHPIPTEARPSSNERLGKVIFHATLGLCVSLIWVVSVHAQVTKLAQTGQTSCYSDSGEAVTCSGTGQDGEKRAGQVWPSPRFEVDYMTVKDNLTGLTWTKIAREMGFEYACFPTSNTTAMTWEQAFLLADCLNSKNYGGYSDWRIPNVLEMESLINLEDVHGIEWLSKEGFQNAFGSFWTSTTAAFDESFAYRINYFHPGSVSVARKTDQNAVWPVRGKTSGVTALIRTGQTKTYHAADDGELQGGVVWPEPRFEVEGECIYDVLTGLLWTKSMDIGGGDRLFDDAISLAQKGKYCGYSDWRVPNHRELLSMINFGAASNMAWLKEQGFTSPVSSQDIWSSSAYTYQPNSVWVLMLKQSTNLYADVKQKRMGYKNKIWLVRSVPPTPPSISQVVPFQGPNDYPLTIYVNGSGFSNGDTVVLGDKALNTYYSSTKQLAAYVPMAISPGIYPIKIKRNGNVVYSMQDAFNVLTPSTDDLFIVPEEFYSNRQIEIVGQASSLNVLVRRFGGIDPVNGLQVRFFKGASVSGELLATGTIPVINPYSSVGLSVNWTPDTAGLNYITLQIDSPSTETNTANNTLTTAVQVVKLQPTPTPLPTKAAATPRPTPTPVMPDQVAPVINSFELDNGLLNNTSGSMSLIFSASDPGAGTKAASGVAWAYYVVWEFFPWANDWFATYDSGWFPAVEGSNNFAVYSPGYFSGPRFIELWVADKAQNVSAAVSRLSNFIKPDDFVIEGESKWYLYPLNAGETVNASSYYRWGDADLYLWAPDWQTRKPWSSLFFNPDTIAAFAPIDGYYWLEVYGYQSAAFDLSVQLGLYPKARASFSEIFANTEERSPKTAPGISMNLPVGLRKLQANLEAFRVQLSAPKNGATVKGSRVVLKWKPIYLGKAYIVQISTNGKRWKKLARSKATRFTITKLQAGKNYYWRVQGLNPLSPSGVWSETGRFRVKAQPGR